MGAIDPRRNSGSRASKKKDLKQTYKKPATPDSVFRSAFESGKNPVKAEAMFLPPEAFGGALEFSDQDDDFFEITSASSWDVAVRYHEFKAKPGFDKIAKRLRKLSARAIVERAQAVLGSVVHPVENRVAPFSEVPFDAIQPDLDIEETLEQSPQSIGGEVWMSYQVPRRQSVVLSVDTSLSMTGEKLALTAVALAVVLLQFPDDLIGIVAFENEGKILKRPDEKIGIQELLERFLDVPAQGYTHLEDGMRVTLKLVRGVIGAGQGRPPSAVLLTDGKYTAGRDPAYLAPRFPHLIVMKMGTEKASLELCQELARKGRGNLEEVADLEQLPRVMYGVVKDLLRGTSFR